MNDSPEEYLHKISQIAISSRCSDVQVVATDEHILQELDCLKEAIEYSKEYPLGDNLLSTLASFSSDIVGKPFENEDIKEFPRTDNCSNKWVGYASCCHSDEVLVVKAFPVNDVKVCNFLRELSATELLNSLELKRARVVKILGAGKTVLSEKGLMLFAESFAEGTSVLEIVRSVIQDESVIEKAQRVVNKVGLALGELHNKNSGKTGRMPRYRLERICINYAINQKRSSEIVSQIDWFKMAQHYEKTLENAETLEFVYGYQHGEAHMESFLYNDSSDTLTIIDVPQVHFSVDDVGEPMGVPAYDFVRFEEHLSSIQGEGLRKEVFKLLKDSFREGYTSTAKALPDRELRELFKLPLKMWGLGTFFDWEQTGNSQEKLYNSFMFHSSLEYFEGLLT
ncbi:MAG: hypothetical protein ACI9S8_001230 [Chlamydiales bacterium]|jgi:hypothetical protein